MQFNEQGLGGAEAQRPTQDRSRDRQEKLAPVPNQFYQEKILQYLSGEAGVFRDPTLRPTAFDENIRNTLIKGIAAGKYDIALQMMMQQQMSNLNGMSAEQMRQVCADQVEMLRKDGHQRLINDRFKDAEEAVHDTLKQLYYGAEPLNTRAERVEMPAMSPLSAAPALPVTREQPVDPELENQRKVRQFFEAQKILLQSRLGQIPNPEAQRRFQTSERINLITRALANMDAGKPFSAKDAPLLVFFINEAKANESNRLALAQAKIGNDGEQKNIAATVSQLWQMGQYIEQHQEKPSV